jgi:nicotinamide mononucleotide adenylyltransferase
LWRLSICFLDNGLDSSRGRIVPSPAPRGVLAMLSVFWLLEAHCPTDLGFCPIPNFVGNQVRLRITTRTIAPWSNCWNSHWNEIYRSKSYNARQLESFHISERHSFNG